MVSKLVLAGLTVGLFAAASARDDWCASLLFRCETNRPIALLGALTLLLIVGLVAAWVPSRRITKVGPDGFVALGVVRAVSRPPCFSKAGCRLLARCQGQLLPPASHTCL